MTITSINHNPNNDSKFARHRSIWKGHSNQLRRAVVGLRSTSGVTVYEYYGTPVEVGAAVLADWNFSLSATRMAPRGMQVLGTWDIAPPSRKIEDAVPGPLRSDLRLLWRDFILIAARRIGFSNGAGSDNTDNYRGKSLLVFAPGPDSFDLIVSKYGYGDGLKRNHYFYHWQSRGTGFQGIVKVDDYEMEDEGVTFYVVS